MKEVRFFYVPNAAEQSELPQEEAVHALRVLRLKEGDEIFLQDGKGVFHRAQVTIANNKHCFYDILESEPQQRMWNGRMHLAIAPTKNIDRMEWMAEKATEVGFDELTFLDCQFSERRQLRVDRIEKIVVSAMKQSRKAWLPKVNEMVPFRQFVSQPRQGRKFIAHCYDEISRADLFEQLQQNPSDETLVLVGPEGDFSVDEVKLAMDNGFEPISLGTSRLRTETAGLVAVTMAHLAKRLSTLLVLLVCVLGLVSCAKEGYQRALPANSTALMSVDVSKVSGVGSNALLQTLLMASGTDDCGIDLTQKIYLFETADGTLGLCASVRDSDHLKEVLSNLATKGRCKPVEALSDAQVSVLNGSWAVAFNDEALLLAGPVVVADQRQMQQRLIRYLGQDEERSGKASQIFENLDSIDAPMALVAQAQALPEQLVSPFLLGAPHDAEPSQVIIAAAMHKEKDHLLMEGKTFSFNKKIDAALKESAKVFRPIEGTYLNALDKSSAMGVFMNVDGNEFLPLMLENEGLLALLAGINSAIDMNLIVKSINGDMAITMPTLSKEKNNLYMIAKLSHNQWIMDVPYWKTSCKKGSRIVDWAPNGYCYESGSTSFYFGVKKTDSEPKLQFYSGTTSEGAAALLSPAPQPLSSNIVDELKGCKMGIVFNISNLTSSDNPMGHAFPFVKPLLGDVATIVYTTK
ncbi:MAG: 16S rRNA (uracil(1498)-N(3))-methyltransferase [Prevotella sp.]|nr:16S rRNA (uracil(1498)-N(3))-methyltransferase [Prevotella sp.]